MNNNPYMMILKADPERYLCKPAATVLALAKAAQAGLSSYLLVTFLLRMLSHAGHGGTTADLILLALPGRLIPLAQYLVRSMGETPFVLAALCVLSGVICSVVEAAAMLVLRFALTGAGVLKRVHQVVLGKTLVLLATLTIALVLRSYRFFTTEFAHDPMMRTIRPFLLLCGLSIPVLVLLARYHRDVVTVFSAIDFELRLEYKDLIEAPVLGACSALFSIAALSGAVLLGLRSGVQNLAVLTLALLSIKYFAVSQGWDGFRRCHR